MAKTWFITGTSGGLGRLLTERLLARGDKVVATLRRAGALDDLIARYGENMHVVTFDVSDVNAMRKAVHAAFQWAGRVDVVVSNAAYGLFGAAEELSDAQIEKQIATNLVGSIQFIRENIPLLRAQGGGRIVQISSEGGQMAYPGFSLYHATKWGVEGFIESVAQEVASFNIDFVIVEPGPTQTNFGRNLEISTPLACYEGTPFNDVRKVIDEGTFPIKGDAERTVKAMVEAIDQPEPPFRLPLGSTAFENLQTAWSGRLEKTRPLKDIAYSADQVG